MKKRLLYGTVGTTMYNHKLKRIVYGALGVVLALGGWHQYEVWRDNQAPLEISLQEYLQHPTKAQWLRLTGCVVDYPGSVIRRPKQDHNVVNDMSSPVYPDYNFAAPVHVVRVEQSPDINDVRSHAHSARTESIEGLIKSGPFYTGMNKDLQRVAHFKLGEPYVLIDVGKTPNAHVALAMVLFGALCLICATWPARAS